MFPPAAERGSFQPPKNVQKNIVNSRAIPPKQDETTPGVWVWPRVQNSAGQCRHDPDRMRWRTLSQVERTGRDRLPPAVSPSPRETFTRHRFLPCSARALANPAAPHTPCGPALLPLQMPLHGSTVYNLRWTGKHTHAQVVQMCAEVLQNLNLTLSQD